MLFLVLVGGSLAYIFYDKIFNPNVVDPLEEPVFYIPTGSSFKDVVLLLNEQGILQNPKSFEWVADKMKFTQSTMKPGRYQLQAGWSNRQLINHLRLGRQAPIQLVINSVRTLPELYDLLAEYIEASPVEIQEAFTDPVLLFEEGYSDKTLMTHFVPNTYEVYWNTAPKDLFVRLKKEREKFWDQKNRKSKLKERGLTIEEAYTLASIVEKESINEKEKPTIAGVYLNRIEKGIRLQADPTVVFAVGDFTINRVLNKHLRHPSPYNTYMHDGLPPGPICMPSISSLDAVVNAEDHNYIFFCAQPGNNRTHAFAETLAEHNRNARRFHRWLDQNGIK